MLVLSLNVDDNPALAGTFLHESRLTFPVLLNGRAFWEHSFEVLALPMNYFIDPQGRRSDEPTRGNDDEWVTRTLATMQKIAAGK